MSFHCVAFSLVMHVVPEKIRLTLAKELFWIVHKDRFYLLIIFLVH